MLQTNQTATIYVLVPLSLFMYDVFLDRRNRILRYTCRNQVDIDGTVIILGPG